ncbi:MAG: Spo0B domain-containing protein [Alicyclobacillaceae bacterium]|nr:Spo0B domain-containing protein [Alicyclobacillaceae bacterium]
MGVHQWFILWGIWSAAWFWSGLDGGRITGWAVASLGSGVYVLWSRRARGKIHSVDGGSPPPDSGEVLARREEAWMRALQHLRHHWLNELQLIRGYAQLRRWERVEDVVNRVVETAKLQSAATDFAHPHRSGLILRMLCEFPRISVEWDGPRDKDLCWRTVDGVEPALRERVGARLAGCDESSDSGSATVTVLLGARAEGNGFDDPIPFVVRDAGSAKRDSDIRKGAHHVD